MCKIIYEKYIITEIVYKNKLAISFFVNMLLLDATGLN